VIDVVIVNDFLLEDVHVVDVFEEAFMGRQQLHTLDVLFEFLHVALHFCASILEPSNDLLFEILHFIS